MDSNQLNLITLRCSGRSGSYFLHRLFDNHSNILCLPTVFPFYFNWRVYHSIHRQKRERDILKLVNYFFDKTQLKYLFNGVDEDWYSYKEENGTERLFTIDREQFLRHLLREVNNRYPTRKEFLIQIHLAYAKTMKLDISKKKFILLHEHYPYEFKEVMEDFKDAKQMLTIRDPRNLYASALRYHINKKGILFAPLFILRWIHMTIAAFVNAGIFEKEHPNNIFYVQIEKLNSQPKETLVQITQWLGVEYEDTLMKPTFIGNPFPAAGSFHANTQSVGKEVQEKRWVNYCSEREINIIDHLFNRVDSRFGYRDEREMSTFHLLSRILSPDWWVYRFRLKGIKNALIYFFSLDWLFSRIFFIRTLRLEERTTYIKSRLIAAHLVKLLWRI